MRSSNTNHTNSGPSCVAAVTQKMVAVMTTAAVAWMHIMTAALAAVHDLPPLEVKGYKFFDSGSGDEFVVKGVDYYPRPNQGDLNANSLDLFTDEHRHIWERDLPYLQELGVNAVRLYAVDASKNHDAFMCAMAQAGIYVIVALAHDCPTCAVTRDQAPDCYPVELKMQGESVISAFAKYSNVLGFSAGNEVNHFAPPNQPEWNAPCQKKFLRDMRAYIAACDHVRHIPVGLVSADDARADVAHYYNCAAQQPSSTNNNDARPDPYEAAEWYGLNSYVFCDGTAQTYSDALGFQLLEQSFASYNYSIPVLLTEFGCLSDTFPSQNGFPGQRTFLQAKWLLSEPSARAQFAGGFAFEYSIEMENAKSQSPFPFTRFGKQNYGLGYYSPEHCDDLDIPCAYHPLPSFNNLQRAYTNTTVLLVNESMKSFTPSRSRTGRSPCPSRFPSLLSFQWKADAQASLKCPTARATSFHCPANLEDLFRNEERDDGNCNKTLPSNSSLVDQASAAQSDMPSTPSDRWMWMLLIGFGVAVLCFMAMVIAQFMLKSRNPNLPVPTILTVVKDADSSKDGSESDGLLSMRRFDEAGNYQALDSDSSVEDEEFQGRR